MKDRLDELFYNVSRSLYDDEHVLLKEKDFDWLIETVEEQQATIETLSMAHDNMARELSLVKEKDKHELIKANIALNKRVEELEEKLYQDERQKVIEGLYEENKHYREVINKFFELDGGYKDIVNRAERMFIKVLDEIGG